MSVFTLTWIRLRVRDSEFLCLGGVAKKLIKILKFFPYEMFSMS